MKIICGKKVDLRKLSYDGFDLIKALKKVGWIHFFNMDEQVYPTQVLDFWENAEVRDSVIVSVVDEQEMFITRDLLAQATACESIGKTYHRGWERSYSIEEIKECLCINTNEEEMTPENLKKEVNLLYYIITRCVCPTEERRNELVSDFEKFLLFHLVKGVRINLNATIFKYLAFAITNEWKTELPYGMLLTKIFEENGLDMSGFTASKTKGENIILISRKEKLSSSDLVISSTSSGPNLNGGNNSRVVPRITLKFPGMIEGSKGKSVAAKGETIKKDEKRKSSANLSIPKFGEASENPKTKDDKETKEKALKRQKLEKFEAIENRLTNIEAKQQSLITFVESMHAEMQNQFKLLSEMIQKLS
ncbi:hypothetical protein RIF29_05433 [Crotalaria pallida]|uniref:Putative plant transposon protein domain-containing protein n=1 Tax=Crotalaria pallida TaxID=3830 RepID=A0AAN9P9S0_CROPI